MAARSTFDLYQRLAQERPVKARCYQRSIADTLARPNIHPIERARLTEALAGIGSVLAPGTTCAQCGRELTDPESIARGIGPDCAERVAVSA